MKQLLMVLALIAELASAAGVVLAEARVILVTANDESATLPKLKNCWWFPGSTTRENRLSC